MLKKEKKRAANAETELNSIGKMPVRSLSMASSSGGDKPDNYTSYNKRSSDSRNDKNYTRASRTSDSRDDNYARQTRSSDSRPNSSRQREERAKTKICKYIQDIHVICDL